LVDRLKLAFEIINFLFSKGTFVSTTEIHEYLFKRGFLKDSSPYSSERRKLNRLLADLELIDCIESESASPKGRKAQKWRINYKAFPSLISITDEELISLLTFATFVPDAYRKLPLFSPFYQLILRLSERIDEKKRKLVEKSFVYESQFLEKFIEFDETQLRQVYDAVIENRALRVKYKNSDAFKIFPVKIFVYNGIIYVGAVREDKKYRTYHLAGLRILEKLNETLPAYYRKKYEEVTFFMEDEKPFVFGVKIPIKESLDYFQTPHIFPTQFFFERKDDYYLVYLVGFPGPRFTSRFLVEEVIEIISPSEDMLNFAKDHSLRKKFPEISYSLKENKRRFEKFMEDFKLFLEQRRQAIGGF